MVAPQGHLAQRSASCTLPKLHKLTDVALWPVARVRIVQYLINTKLWVSVEGPEPILADLVEFYVAEGHAKANATKLAEEGIAQHRAAAPLALDVLSNLVDWDTIVVYTCVNMDCLPDPNSETDFYQEEYVYTQLSDDFSKVRLGDKREIEESKKLRKQEEEAM